jgi:hypothetical protein
MLKWTEVLIWESGSVVCYLVRVDAVKAGYHRLKEVGPHSFANQ